VDEVAADQDVGGDRRPDTPACRRRAQVAVGEAFLLDDPTDRLAQPLAALGGLADDVVEPARLPPQPELSEADPAGDVLAGAADEGQLELVDEAGAVGGQVREQPATGDVLWSQKVPAFRGMNILTPVVFGDAVFTSCYQNKSRLYRVARDGNRYTVAEAWNNNAQGYMSTPVVIDGHAYLHLQDQRFTCIDLRTGERSWTSKAFGKYCSLVAQGDRILALDQRGSLLLLRASPKEFELLDEMKVSDEETWAHLAVAGDELYVRELDALAAYRWQAPAK
jgi:outer membrane protein assembly factor BamB